MKKNQLLKGLLFSTFIALLFSCSKKSSTDEVITPTTTGSLSATIAGASWASASATGDLSTSGTGGTSTSILQLVGVKADYTTVSVQIPLSYMAVGSYSFTGSNALCALAYSSFSGTVPTNYNSARPGGSFVLTISQVDNVNGTITGTFSGTVVSSTDSSTKQITNGVITSVKVSGSQFYTGGTMSLTKNGGSNISMGNSNNTQYVYLAQTTNGNSITANGYNYTTNYCDTFSLTFPKTVTPGTYNLATTNGFGAGYTYTVQNNQTKYNVTSGSMTVTSHNGLNVIGTYNFTATNGSQTVNITNGTFNLTHK